MTTSIKHRPGSKSQPLNRQIPRLSLFAKQLAREWRALGLPRAGESIVVAVSGGADSVALLLALNDLVQAGKLPIDLIVGHFNHKLRGKASDADARWVAALSNQLSQRFVSGRANVKRRADRTGDNLEQAARRARYEFLQRVATSHKAVAILTAHTLSDQAETVLLNLLRGSGTEGLGGIDPVRSFDKRASVMIARPLLAWASRSDTEAFCRERQIEFRIDEMNADESFARVRVRRQLLPLMRTFNPKIEDALSRTAEILRDDNEALNAAAERLIELSFDETRAGKQDAVIRTDLLRMAQPALRKRALRLWIAQQRGHLRRIESAHIEAIENLMLSVKSGRLVELPERATIARNGGRLHYRANKSKEKRTR